MSTIRPQPPQLPAIPPRSAPGGARAAFFQAALTGAAAPAATVSTTAKPQPPVIAPVRVDARVEPQPQRYLRPGSLVDIKV